jgi:PAP2 superfamily
MSWVSNSSRKRSVVWLVAGCIGVSSLTSMGVRADVATDWNETAQSALVDVKGYARVRVETLAAIAVFNALNAIDTRYRFYGPAIVATEGTPPDLAAAAAAYAVLVSEPGSRKDVLDAAYNAALKKVENAAVRGKGVALGRVAAAQLLSLRAGDNFPRLEYAAREPAAGVWELTPGHKMPGAATFKTVRPLVIAGAAAFDPGPPPAVGSEQAVRDIVESRSVGARIASTRTADQTAACYFWNVDSPSFDRAMIESIVKARKLAPVDTARMLALLAIVEFDGSIVQVEFKDKYRSWRPYNAIRGKFADPAYRDDNWEPLARTPSSPDWPSGGAQGAGIYEVMLANFAADAPVTWSYFSDELGIERSWASPAAMADELTNQRVWIGVHFRSATTAGRKQGRDVAAYVLANALQPQK